MTLTADIKGFAVNGAGFDLAGVTGPALESFYGQAFRKWIESGHAGALDYMKRDPSKRSDARLSLPLAASVIVLALNYFHPEDPHPAGPAGKVAQYAYGRDYHRILEKKLKVLSRFVLKAGGAGTETKFYVDTGPVLERAFAREAGLGFIGKNTNLITREYGSWVFLACLFTNLKLEPDEPHPGSCGSCTLCIDACPTDALLGDRVLDASRCISYWTIESKVPAPPALRERFGEWVFGCDICQQVCPYNFRAKTTRHDEIYPLKKAGTWLDPTNTSIEPGSPLRRSKTLKPA